MRKRMRARYLVKLRPISISSRSMLRRPSAMLIRQNGIRIATSTKITPKWPGSNQIAARMAQPIDGNELSTGLIRSSTTPSSQGTPQARNASPPPIRSAAVIETSTRQADVATCHRKSGVTESSTSRRATAAGPGRMNSGRPRPSTNQASSTMTTMPSPSSRPESSDGTVVRSARIVPRHAPLQRTEHVAVHAVHEGNDDDDGGEDRRRVELLPRQFDHVAEPAVSAEQLGGQCHLPVNAEHDAQGR